MWRIRDSVNKELNEIGLVSRLTDKATRRKFRDLRKVADVAYLTTHTIKDLFQEMTDNCMNSLKISPSQRKKLLKLSENQAQQSKVLLQTHFVIGSKGREGLDVVMQEIFYPQYKDAVEYRPFVHQMAEYTIKHWEYLQTASFDDFLYATLDWDVLRMDRELVRRQLEMMEQRGENVEEIVGEDIVDEDDIIQEDAR